MQNDLDTDVGLQSRRNHRNIVIGNVYNDIITWLYGGSLPRFLFLGLGF